MVRMSKTSKICCMQCNEVKCIHVEDVKDICMECNAMYSRLNDMHVKDVKDDTNTHNIAF